jgi:hypothetical protein
LLGNKIIEMRSGVKPNGGTKIVRDESSSAESQPAMLIRQPDMAVSQADLAVEQPSMLVAEADLPKNRQVWL